MASFAVHLYSFFFLLVLLFSLQIQARESKFFSKVTNFKISNSVPNPNVTIASTPESAPAPAPELESVQAPTPESVLAPTPESVLAPYTPAPAPAPIDGEREDGYGLYGRDPSQLTPTKEAPATKIGESELMDESYNAGYNSKTNQNEYVTNYNNNKGYNNNYYKSSSYSNNYNNNGYYNGNSYESERQGMSDTRVLENVKYYHNINGYESEKGSTRNEVTNKNNMYPNEFNTMEEYEKQQESQVYVP